MSARPGVWVWLECIFRVGHLGPSHEFPQTFRYFNDPMREFEKAYKEGRIFHNGSSWLRYCLQNVRVETNKYSEIRPYRKVSVDKIDSAVSTLLAFVTCLTTQN